ncbi:aryl-alcohol dehydrogenase-like predicted oxidoreductase [Kineococcus xinjiangensis]|uniref:Aryl-alcohol dehydrogenase-like predicted oxidoreductase n=1 Tax=Kineococcus xinjiangensis TaxID=512762 RepID=A0A2S6IUV4_9ACTN|nr:aldo/keto reductase [Kineococcus xinjiangensis]PPK98055.1 aryl-alcohol dehydrogenase-like predicted oxidoreductase [Kineococcus xinjiangensis]
MTTTTMRAKVQIGRDLTVARIGYGAMRLSDQDVWRGPVDRAAAITLLRGAADRGVELFDTADSYALGDNEELLGEAFGGRDDITIVTKAGVSRPGPTLEEWIPLGRPEYLKQQAELSLRRLRMERLPLFLLHRVDPTVPLAEQIGALKELQEAGKVGQVGLSQVTVEQIEEAMRITEITAVQNLFNLSTRDDNDVVDFCESAGIAFMPFFPIAVGELAKRNGALAVVADEVGATPAQVSLAWLLHRSPVIAPIPGTSSVAHLEENLAAAEIHLSDEQLVRLVEDA